jgi:hypothetical protein
MTKPSRYLKHEQKIAATSTAGIVERWRYGRDLLKDKADRKQLPHGLIEGIITEAERSGIKLTRREIQRRLQCAEIYASEAKVRRAGDALGSWTALHEAGFPTLGDDLDDLPDGVTAAAPDEWEQLSLIPGLGEVLKVRGRSIPLEEATIGDVAAYRDMYAGIHANFAKRLALIENALRIMREAGAGDDANALDAWKRGLTR